MDVNLKNTPSEIDRLIDKYKSTVYGIAIARLGSKADADDVFQEWFLRHRKDTVNNTMMRRSSGLLGLLSICAKR